MSSIKRALVIAYAAVVALFTFATLGQEPYDDSYFFKRFALNALDHGTLAWNVADGPVYGITSQLFQAICVVIAALTRQYWMFATRIFLAVCLIGAFSTLLATTCRANRGGAATVACCSPVALYSVLSGMETALSFVLLAVLLWLLFSDRGRRQHWALAPLVGFFSWLLRPDSLLLAVPPLLIERWAATRRPPLRELSCLGALVLTSLGVFELYYGSALPLPFYAKQLFLSPYDPDFVDLSRQAQKLRFAIFLVVGLPLALVGALRIDRINLTLLGSVSLFELYHYTTTIDVMGMHGRFYAPALPLLVVAAARTLSTAVSRAAAVGLASVYFACVALLAIAGFLATGPDSWPEGVPLPYYLVAALGASTLFLALVYERISRWGPPVVLVSTALAVALSHGFAARLPPSDREFLEIHASRVTVFRGIDALRGCFGDEIDVYHSEIGVPGLIFQRGRVVDLSGLMSPQQLFRHSSFEQMCSADRPEAIFLPHKNYRALNAEIQSGRCIQGYRRVVQESSSPLHVREDLHARYLECTRAQGSTNIGR